MSKKLYKTLRHGPKWLAQLPLKATMPLILAAVLSLGYSELPEPTAAVKQQTPAVNAVTMLDPFTLAEFTLSVTDIKSTARSVDGDWWRHRYRHRRLRGPYKPPFPS